MSFRKQKNNDGPYAQTFKPSLILGSPTAAQLLNQVFLVKREEVYDANNNQMLYQALGHDESSDNPDAQPFYSFETTDVAVKPTIRNVSVKGKEDFTNAYLFEAGQNENGICLVMMKEIVNASEVYCNIRFMPYSKVSDVLSGTKNDLLSVVIPQRNVIKLNVTLKPSVAGEILYSTHKTDVNLENITSDQLAKLKNKLEFGAANYVAHYANLFLESQKQEAHPHGNLRATNLALPTIGRGAIKKILLGVCLVSGIVAGSTASAAFHQEDSTLTHVSIFFATLANTTGALSSLISDAPAVAPAAPAAPAAPPVFRRVRTF